MFRLARLVTTARYLTARQLVTRALRVAERQWWRVRRPRAPRPDAPPLRPHTPLWSGGLQPAGGAHDLAAGRFEFLNVARQSPRWDEPEVSQLWRYHLHYFDYARDADAATFRRLAHSWIEANDRIGGDGWHPYTISLRIVNWCEAADAFDLRDDAPFLSSLYGQARFLAGHLERDVRGNHLLKNLRALIWAGTFFDGAEAERWRARGLKLLREEIDEQVLADGGHFERAPGYHVQVVRDLDETAEFLRRNGIVLEWLDGAIARMRAFLAAIVPPGGRLPLLKDTYRRAVDDLVDARASQPSRMLEASGYAVVRDDARGDFLIADVGRVCPDYLPAHAHADMFSFELTIGGRPTIVDSGIYEYERGRWRDWFRSTAAHNTVEVGGRNQSDVWDRFRVAARARPFDVRWIEREDGIVIIQGSHDGYAPASHRRTIAVSPRLRAWAVIDEVRGGAAGQKVRSRIHLHPDLIPAELRFSSFGAVRLFEEEGWYSEEFGAKTENRVIVFEATTPAFLGYAVSAHAGVSILPCAGGVEVAAGGSTFRVELE